MEKLCIFGQLIRVKHYLKNVLIFVPVFFSGKLFAPDYCFLTLMAFICFCLVSSIVYIINDIKDKDKDKKHSNKCLRPIAANKVSIKQAILVLFIITIILLLIIFFIKLPIISIIYLIIYLFLNIFYSFGLKSIPIVDVAIVVAGFIIRLLFGASLFQIEVSNWLYLTILSIAFYLALGKRRGEYSENDTRDVLKFYNKAFFDKNMYMFLAISIVFYSLWATDTSMVSKSDNMLIWTIPLMIFICMKYSLDVEVTGDGDPISTIFKDKILIVMSIVFLVVHLAIIYF